MPPLLCFKGNMHFQQLRGPYIIFHRREWSEYIKGTWNVWQRICCIFGTSGELRQKSSKTILETNIPSSLRVPCSLTSSLPCATPRVHRAACKYAKTSWNARRIELICNNWSCAEMWKNLNNWHTTHADAFKQDMYTHCTIWLWFKQYSVIQCTWR